MNDEIMKKHTDRWFRWYGVTRDQLIGIWKKKEGNKEAIENHFHWCEKVGMK